MFETVTFHLNAMDVRDACIKNDWYNAGSCKDYSVLLDYVDEHLSEFDTAYMPILMGKLEYVAENIRKHTDWDENAYDCTVSEFEANIASVLLDDYAQWTVELL
jgi:hypothetical protein